MINMHLKGIE